MTTCIEYTINWCWRANFLNELDARSVIKILSFFSTPPIITDNSSLTFAPILKPCVIPAGLTSLSANPKR